MNWCEKPCEYTKRSHINFCVYDSTWEASEAFTLDHDPNVDAWVKNDHLGFEVLYVYKGVVKKYRPDFLIRLTSATVASGAGRRRRRFRDANGDVGAAERAREMRRKLGWGR